MAIQKRMLTVWHFLKEDKSGSGEAAYCTACVFAYASLRWERGDAGAGDRYTGGSGKGRSHRVFLDGFLICGGDGLFGKAEDADVLSPVPDRDFVALGDCCDYLTPGEAMAAGIAVYSIVSVVRPPKISDGTLVDWICFSAQRNDCRAGV